MTPHTHISSSPRERLFELSVDMLCVAGLDGYFKVLNDAFSDTLGYSKEELQAKPFVDFVHPDDRDATVRQLENLAQGALTAHFGNRYRCKDGSYRWLEWSAHPEPGEGLVFAVARDVTREKEAEIALNESNALLETLNRAQTAFIDRADPRELFNDLLNRLLILTRSEYGFIGEVLFAENGNPFLRTHAITNVAWNEPTQALYDETANGGMDFHNLDTLYGAVMIEETPIISNNPQNDPRAGGLPPGHPELRAFLGLPFVRGDETIGMVGLANRPGGYDAALVERLQPYRSTCATLIDGYRNRQRREAAERALDRMARIDDLTELPNRRAFIERLDIEIQRAARYDAPLCLLAIDLDRFKNVNDTYGHAVGDGVLRRTAEILRDECRASDYPGRLGGEEFGVFLTQTAKENARVVAERIRAQMADQTFRTAGAAFSVTCSIGVAAFGPHAPSTDRLLALADERLYEAKASGRNRVGV